MALDTYATGSLENQVEALPALTPSANHQNLLSVRWDTPIEILNLKEGERVFSEGENPKAFYVVRSGAIKLSVRRPVFRGRTGSPDYIMKVLGPGDLFGYRAILKGTNQEEQAKALRPSEVAVYSREAMQAILNGPQSLGKMVLTQIIKDLESKEAVNQLHYLASVHERIALQLVLLADRFGVVKEDGIHLNLKLTRNELAQLAGTINESLSRHLTELKGEGILDLSGKEIIIKNRQALIEKTGNHK